MRPTGVRFVPADRSTPTAYDEVAGRRWDAVVDVSWQPTFVREALDRLALTTDHWLYVSSGSAYADDRTAGQGEDAPLHDAYAGGGPVDGDVYGPAKVACEQACRSSMGAEHTLIARVGLIGGYGDRSDRLGYWPARVARAADAEPVLVPPLDSPVQVIDVEDLALWLVRAAERRTSGVLNAMGDVTTMGAVLRACVATTGRRPHFVPATHEWLVAERVEPWMGPESLPLWVPPPEYAGHQTRRNQAAVAAGLELRPLMDTVTAALRWERELGLGRHRTAGLGAERERALLAGLTGDAAHQPSPG